MNSKPWYQSKTLWFNVLAGVLIALQAAGVIDNIPMVQDAQLDPEIQTLIVVVVNLVFRYTTKQPVRLR